MGAVLSRLEEAGVPALVSGACSSLNARLLVELSRLDEALAGELPSAVVLKTVCGTLLGCWLGRFLCNVADHMLEQGVLQSVLEVLKRVPGIAGVVAREKEKLSMKIRKQVLSERYGDSKVPKFSSIPEKQMSQKQVLQCAVLMVKREKRDVHFTRGPL